MRLIVCVKQVPDIAQIRIDEPPRNMTELKGPTVLNPFDEFAVEEALRIREEHGGAITALTIGQSTARDVLVRCFAMGADRAVLLTDPSFENFDTWATSRVLAAAIRKFGFDIIICGMKAIGGETGHVGPELAEMLGIPHISYVRRVEVNPVNGTVIADRMNERGYESIRTTIPCLLTASKALNVPRVPTVVQQRAARKRPIEVLTAKELGLQDDELQQPRIKLESISPAGARAREPVVFNSADIGAAVRQLRQLMEREGIV